MNTIYYIDISKIDINNFKDKKRIDSQVGHLLLKYVFKKFNINIDNYTYSYNENNKPYIKELDYHFNISHDENIVCCIVSDIECGVDVECIKYDRNLDKLAERFLNESELSNYHDLNKIKKAHYFYKRYVQIEAHVKKSGGSILNVSSNIPRYETIRISDSLNNEYYLTSTIQNYTLVQLEYNTIND